MLKIRHDLFTINVGYDPALMTIKLIRAMKQRTYLSNWDIGVSFIGDEICFFVHDLDTEDEDKKQIKQIYRFVGDYNYGQTH